MRSRCGEEYKAVRGESLTEREMKLRGSKQINAEKR